MAASNVPFNFFPRQPRRRMALQMRLASFQFLNLPVVHRNGIGRSGKIVPQVFDELKLFDGA